MVETINRRLYQITRRVVRKIAEIVSMDLDLTAVPTLDDGGVVAVDWI